MQGQVVGVNTAIYSPSAAASASASTFRPTTVQNVVASLEHDGYVLRGYLAIRNGKR